jgi:uncharacterized protein (TIGR02246 family)
MHRIARRVIVLAVALLSLVCLPHASSGQSRASGEAAVRETVKKYVDAREQTDPAAIAALFTSDADQLTSSGEWRKGRDEIVRGTIESSRRTRGTRTITIEAVRFPAPGVALADGRYDIVGAEEGPRRMWTSFVLTRSGSGWRIAAIRNMLPAPPAAPASPAR